MKRCPTCGTTYTDDSLRFCLADGSLLERTDEEPTVFVPPHDPVRVPIESATSSSGQSANISPSARRSWIKIVATIIALGFLALVAAGIAGVAYYYSSDRSGSSIAAKTPTPDPTVRPEQTPDQDMRRLEDELANLQRLLEEQRKTPASPAPLPTDIDEERGSSITARVDSPNDGFLALRDAPDAQTGRRLTKIPHNAEVEIQNCEKKQVTIGDRTGRWCQVTYEGLSGWVFDAWLDY